jgi:hypothetical protein
MHDPMSVAFTIPNPFAARYDFGERWRDRPAIITVWHKDPERGGVDNSCWQAYHFKAPTEQEQAITEVLWDGETIFDNRPHFPNSPEHRWFQKLKAAWLEHQKRRTLCRIPWRWHFWHWRVVIEPLTSLKRWLFSRCCQCGKRFPWGYAPVSRNWDAPGPRWFRGERGVYHHDCATEQYRQTAKVGA